MTYFERLETSNSGLGQINPEEGGSPLKYQEFYRRDKEKKDSVSLTRGTLLHSWIQHREQFVISDIEKPSAMMCKWVEEVKKRNDDIANYGGIDSRQIILDAKRDLDVYSNTKDEDKITSLFLKEGHPYLKFLNKSDGKIAMTAKDRDIIEACQNSVITHPQANYLLFNEIGSLNGVQYHSELEIYWVMEVMTKRYGIVNVPCKAMLDRVIIDPINKKVSLIDLKTTGFSVYLYPTGSFIDYHYYRQMAFYVRALQEYLKQQGFSVEGWDLDVRMVVVETFGLHQVVVFDIGMESLTLGRNEYHSLLKRVALHTASNDWSMSLEEMNNNGILKIA